MRMPKLLITGPTGNVGFPLVQLLQERGVACRLAVRQPGDARLSQLGEQVAFDFADPATFAPALADIERVFLVRPPQLADTERYFAPFVKAMQKAGVQQVVLLSLQGAERAAITPHRKIEKLILQRGLPYTLLRPSFFMQNLSTTHRTEIAQRGELIIPAGQGRTSFIDARDIAEVAAKVLTEEGHLGAAYELTGSVAVSYEAVAEIMSSVLERPIRYSNPSYWRFWQWRRQLGDPWHYILIMTALYTICRLGLASQTTTTAEQLLGRPPRTLGQFVADYRDRWALH
jgi:uncharacterized protein YbjT (DUF2867 family)